MTLRQQLLLVCLSLLVLPAAVFLFVGELDRNLRQSQERETQARATAAAKALAADPQWSDRRARPESKTLFAGLLSNGILLDGYAHDWSAFEYERREFKYAHNKITLDQEDLKHASEFTVHAATRYGRLYFFLNVTDDRLVFHRPRSRPNQHTIATGDSVIIRVPDEHGNIRRITFRWDAPGEEVGRYLGAEDEGARPVLTDTNYRAVLAETAGGYNVEVRMPLPANGQFGLSIIDRDTINGFERWTGMFDPNEEDDIGQLKTINRQVNGVLNSLTEPGDRIRVFDGQGWLRGDSDQRMPDAVVRKFDPAEATLFDAIVYRFIAWSLAKNLSAGELPGIDSGKLGHGEFEMFTELTDGVQYLQDKYRRIFFTALARIEIDDDLHGYVLLQRPRASVSAITEAALLNLVKIFGMAVILVATCFALFASLLSYRVRRLRDQIESTVATDGQIKKRFKRSRAADEIGDVSRSFDDIIRRLGNYTNYLRSLGSRLSHELRTPLSVVATSLESIDRSTLDNATVSSIERAGQGAERLQTLIRNLSEASSLEQTILRAEKERVDLRLWLDAAQQVYQGIYPARRVELDCIDDGVCTVDASVELLHQMFDKLLSNAVDFSAPDSVITLRLRRQSGSAAVMVENIGTPLPDSLREELFQPMVSERQVRDDQPHMGLGLYIVKLIADFHGATVRAQNLADRNTVRITTVFPLSQV
jgi:dedicated sortase system histidine kinase